MSLFPPLPPHDGRPRIVLDLRMVQGRLHGIARYALELTRRLPSLAPELAFVGLTPPGGLPADLGPLTPEIPLVPCAAGFLTLAEQAGLLASLVRLRPALFHATSFSLPALWPGRLVATLHDANHLVLRHNYGPGRIAYYRAVVGPRARRAKALITVSEFSRTELARELSLSPSRLQVIHNGVDERFFAPAPAEVRTLRQRFSLPLRFFAVVGNDKPHKNLSLIARIARALPAPVVLLGAEASAESLGFPTGTLSLPSLGETELPAFYAAASALLLPSRYEGFGLPAIEAMASGCPVIAARGSSLDEVIGNAGRRLDPDDDAAWIDAAQRVLSAPTRGELIERGRERAARFRWSDCAQETLAVYRRALER